MDNETKDTLKKVAEYATEEQKKLRKRVNNTILCICIVLLICVFLFARETKGLLNGIVPESVCAVIMAICLVVAIALVVLEYLYYFRGFDKFIERKKSHSQNAR